MLIYSFYQYLNLLHIITYVNKNKIHDFFPSYVEKSYLRKGYRKIKIFAMEHLCDILSNVVIVNTIIAELYNIIYQVASNEIEEGEIRSQALEAIIDMATVYDTLYKDYVNLYHNYNNL